MLALRRKFNIMRAIRVSTEYFYHHERQRVILAAFSTADDEVKQALIWPKRARRICGAAAHPRTKALDEEQARQRRAAASESTKKNRRGTWPQ